MPDSLERKLSTYREKDIERLQAGKSPEIPASTDSMYATTFNEIALGICPLGNFEDYMAIIDACLRGADDIREAIRRESLTDFTTAYNWSYVILHS